MIENLKWEWRLLKEGEPGSRFQAVQEAQATNPRLKWVWMAIGVVITAAGIVALPLPGPGFLVIALGVALIARASATAARVADWIELRIRSIARWASRRWRSTG